MNNWISVKDKLPERLQKVLFTNGKEIVLGSLCDMKTCDEWHYESWDYGNYYTWTREEITHWMFLPELPEMNNA